MPLQFVYHNQGTLFSKHVKHLARCGVEKVVTIFNVAMVTDNCCRCWGAAGG